MNVYKRIQKCRVELKKLEIKESGNNKFAGYTYMELGDFLPHIVDLCDAHGLCTVISFQENATLTIINSDKPEEQVVFTSPMSTAELKGCHAIQNLGAVETYLRRYLYVAAFDIVEHDALDSTHGKDTTERKIVLSEKKETAIEVTEEDKKFYHRIKIALDIIYGSDVDQKKTLIRRLTAWTNKEGKDIPGIEDYRKKTGKGLSILCNQIEKMVPKDDAPSLCNVCRMEPCACCPPEI